MSIAADIPMQTAPAATRRAGGYLVHFDEPFIIASREDDPDGGTFVYPRLWRCDEQLFINWHFDRDMLDARLPDKPNGRVSRDGGRTWQAQSVLAPPGCKVQTGPREITCYWHAYQMPGAPGRYRRATWRSSDGGATWGDLFWTTIDYPGTRGLDYYDPPTQYKHHSANYKGGVQRPEPPPWMLPYFQLAGTRRRGPHLHAIHHDGGTLRALSVARYLPDGDAIADDSAFWNRLDWTRNAIVEHVSADAGRSWTWRGVVAFDQRHQITEFDEENLFSEPALAIYPDGHRVCIMRTGSARPLYLVRSDDGVSWSPPQQMPIRGVDPHLVLMPGGVLVLATGRPDCTIHFSLDRGRTWALSHTLFHCGRDEQREDCYSKSTCNPGLVAVDAQTLLYIHDASRFDPAAPDHWLQRAGHSRVVGRFIHLQRSAVARCLSTLGDAVRPIAQWRQRLADRPRPAPALRIPQRDPRTLTLDGRLDDRFWQDVPRHALRDVESGAAASIATQVQAAWADDALYLAIRCDEPDMARLREVHRSVEPRDFFEADTIELLIRTPRHSYYQVAINPDGAVLGIDRHSGIDYRWSCGAQAAAHHEDAAWSLEVRLPLARENVGIVGDVPSTQLPWFINVCRQRVCGRQRMLWALVPTGVFGFHSVLKFAELMVSR